MVGPENRKGKRKPRRRDLLLANLYFSQAQPVGLDALLPTVAFLIAGTIVWSSKHLYPASFFEISAQVIPVLMLALALELRAFELPRVPMRFKAPRTIEEARQRASDPAHQVVSDRIRGLLVLLAMIASELLSLRAIAYGSADRFVQGFIIGTIAASLVMIAVRVVLGQQGEKRSPSE